MSRSKEITGMLKKADVQLSEYIKGLEKENLKLHKEIARLLVKCKSNENEIKVLKQQVKATNHPMVTIVRPRRPPEGRT